MPADILYWIAAVVRQRFQRFALLRNDSGVVTRVSPFVESWCYPLTPLCHRE